MKEGTQKNYTYQKESVEVTGISSFRQADIEEAEAYLDREPPAEIDPRLEPLVNEIISRVADKWTMLILEVLNEHGVMRFSEIGRAVDGISQKMLTQTLRQMEREGLVTRTIYPVVPPKVEYALTPLGDSLGRAFCGVWLWAERHIDEIESARAAFDACKDK
jgi:DNA-binding HxlR family transcriptional regulator